LVPILLVASQSWRDNRVIRKVKKTQHQNPEFGHTQGEIKKKTLQKSTLALRGDATQKTINFGSKPSFILSFLFLERPHCCYIYFPARNCLTIVISLEPCALNAEFQHFILRFIKMFFLADTIERGDRG